MRAYILYLYWLYWQVVVAAGEYTTGSAWLSEEKLLEQARDMWKRLSDEQKGAYGEDYFENALRSLEKYTKSAVSSKNVTTRNFFIFIALVVYLLINTATRRLNITFFKCRWICTRLTKWWPFRRFLSRYEILIANIIFTYLHSISVGKRSCQKLYKLRSHNLNIKAR